MQVGAGFSPWLTTCCFVDRSRGPGWHYLAADSCNLFVFRTGVLSEQRNFSLAGCGLSGRLTPGPGKSQAAARGDGHQDSGASGQRNFRTTRLLAPTAIRPAPSPHGRSLNIKNSPRIRQWAEPAEGPRQVSKKISLETGNRTSGGPTPLVLASTKHAPQRTASDHRASQRNTVHVPSQPSDGQAARARRGVNASGKNRRRSGGAVCAQVRRTTGLDHGRPPGSDGLLALADCGSPTGTRLQASSLQGRGSMAGDKPCAEAPVLPSIPSLSVARRHGAGALCGLQVRPAHTHLPTPPRGPASNPGVERDPWPNRRGHAHRSPPRGSPQPAPRARKQAACRASAAHQAFIASLALRAPAPSSAPERLRPALAGTPGAKAVQRFVGWGRFQADPAGQPPRQARPAMRGLFGPPVSGAGSAGGSVNCKRGVEGAGVGARIDSAGKAGGYRRAGSGRAGPRRSFLTGEGGHGGPGIQQRGHLPQGLRPPTAPKTPPSPLFGIVMVGSSTNPPPGSQPRLAGHQAGNQAPKASMTGPSHPPFERQHVHCRTTPGSRAGQQ